MSSMRGIVLVLALNAMTACRPDDQRTGTIDADAVRSLREDMDPRVAAHLDSGNASFRDDDFEVARGHYVHATEIDADAAAAWFGLYLAERALGNVEAAQEALSEAQRVAPGASLIHPGDGDTIR